MPENSHLCVFRWSQGPISSQPDNDGGNQDNLAFNYFAVPLVSPAGEWDDENMDRALWYICQYKQGENFTSKPSMPITYICVNKQVEQMLQLLQMLQME